MKSTDSIANLLRKNKRLSRELSRMEAVFNAIKSAIVVCAEDGEVMFANSLASEILGVGESTANLYKIIPSVEDAIKSAKDGVLALRELEISYPEHRLLNLQIIPFDEEEGRFALIFNDITRQKLSTEERIESEKIASVLNLASGVAHEIGNPLNSINIHLQVAKRRLAKYKNATQINDDILDGIEESISVCTEEVSRLDGIIENFLKALRPMRPDFASCDPIKPLAEILRTLHAELENLKISVEVNLSTALPKIYADENLLKQLYFNILHNAMEAMDSGGIIKISAQDDDEFVKISFADTGCGMDEEAISKLFNPYFTTKTTGHGLGMTIIQAIVRAHGGKIDVESLLNKGTTITVSLPRTSKRVRMLDAE